MSFGCPPRSVKYESLRGVKRSEIGCSPSFVGQLDRQHSPSFR
jgi:hypothetical protein